MRMDSYTPVIVIEGFLAFGIVLLLYVLHIREMRQIKAKKARLEKENAHEQGQALAGQSGSGQACPQEAEKNP